MIISNKQYNSIEMGTCSFRRNMLIHSKMYASMVMLLMGMNVFSQQVTYTLDSLQSMARNSYPLTKQLLFAQSKGEAAIKEVNSDWLPKAAIVGSATYQSEVSSISLPSSMPVSVENPAKDQYKAGVEISQLIYDGGVNATRKSIEELNVLSETNRVEAELLQVKHKLNDLYLALLINTEANNALLNVKKDLTARLVNIESAVESGTMLKTTMRELEAEIIGIDQKMSENNSQRVSLLSALSILVQENMDTTVVFVVPETEPFLFDKDVAARPEYKQLTTQMELFDWRNTLIDKGNAPKIALFGNGYYGRPGFDFFNNDFRPYGMAGVRFSWNIGGYYSSSHKKSKLLIDKQIVENKRSLFELGMQTQLSQQEQEIVKLQELIDQDKSVIEIRSEVRETAAVQYENGTITTTDYIIKLNAETQAIITGSMHEIQLSMAFINYKTLLGK